MLCLPVCDAAWRCLLACTSAHTVLYTRASTHSPAERALRRNETKAQNEVEKIRSSRFGPAIPAAGTLSSSLIARTEFVSNVHEVYPRSSLLSLGQRT